ncbi:hypothetical protein D1164_16025 [Mariniphaga sediminis]|uniref:Uncharacterized protein n=1 Tax=Mariniphaga sediminis TaxID=1628158 RepID=A0A399CY39_9BACT|nr:hypothetical protein D1164_16025 [Mariniphaga sediminis]
MVFYSCQYTNYCFANQPYKLSIFWGNACMLLYILEGNIFFPNLLTRRRHTLFSDAKVRLHLRPVTSRRKTGWHNNWVTGSKTENVSRRQKKCREIILR